jgi:MFS family permease
MEATEQRSLTREQKEAVGILSIGTFLEFFDLMLYVHMAVLLNELFFPQTDPFTGSLLTAFAFCSSFVFRPFGALIFGWIGDNIGRKATVTITTIMMAVSCVIMANIPTYAQVGIMASWLVTICRIVQGLSSIGEIVGAELYLTEITKRPVQYPVVAFIEFIAVLGTTAALGIASLAISFGFN